MPTEVKHSRYLDFLILGDITGYRGKGASKVDIALANQSGDELGDSYGGLEVGTHEAFALEILKVVAHEQVEKDGGLDGKGQKRSKREERGV